MNATIKSYCSAACFLVLSLASKAQANLTIVNNSERLMTVKVMQTDEGDGTLLKTITIEANRSEIVYFTKTGYYFTKMKAVLQGTDPIFRKREPFQVTNDQTGYSEMTLTFTIKEAATPQPSGGKEISKEEFEQN